MSGAELNKVTISLTTTSDNWHGFEYGAAFKLKAAIHADILTVVNAAEDPSSIAEVG